MSIDPENPVVKLCAQGMMSADPEEAARLFEQAWSIRRDDYDACIAAHYVALHKTLAEERLVWNRAAIDHARAVNDERVRGFLPSLYLNLGKAYEDLDFVAEARRCYALAERGLADLPPGGYADMVRRGIAEGRARTDAPSAAT